MQNSWQMLAREQKARQLAAYLDPRLQAHNIPLTIIEDMPAGWWENAATAAGVIPPSAETRLLVMEYLWDRQKARREAASGKDNQGR